MANKRRRKPLPRPQVTHMHRPRLTPQQQALQATHQPDACRYCGRQGDWLLEPDLCAVQGHVVLLAFYHLSCGTYRSVRLEETDAKTHQ